MMGRGHNTTSSNESLASNKFYRPRSNTNQSLGSGSASNQPGAVPDEAQENSAEADASDNVVKVGAFVSRPVSANERYVRNSLSRLEF